jgi:hypothetical protein
MKMSPEKLGEKQRLSRKSAARQQIEMSIRLLHSRDFACAVTLALAAEDQLGDTNDPHLMKQIKGKISKDEIDAFNFVRNWLKHHKEPDEIDLFEFEVWVALARAATKFVAVYHQSTKTMEDFFQWSRQRGYASL